jgi:hypothetical protein
MAHWRRLGIYGSPPESVADDGAETIDLAQAKNGLGDGDRVTKASKPVVLNESAPPTLFQRVRHTKSILAVAVSDVCIYGGTEGGEILVSL